MTDNNNSQGLGKGMIIVAWLGVLAVLTMVFQNVLEGRYNPNRNLDESVSNGEIPEVVLQRNAQGHYVAEGRMNRFPVEFLLDTGATDIAIPEAIAEALRLPKRDGGFSQTANGTIAVWKTKVAEVSLGPIVLHDVSASIVPSMAADDPILLGMSFLKKLEMVQRGKELRLRKL